MGAMINEDRFGVCLLALDVGAVGANTSAEQAFTVKGLRPGDFVHVNKPSLHAGLVVSTARVSAADTLAITFGNTTAGAIDPAVESYLLFYFRAEKTFGAAVF
ncbi:hypothetical protein [Phenylobacterium sp.]|uniref:hypothetical protein n=1 Tax=Phenylobacterium sp. TaxID=1871053 RepID=UPI00374D74FD